MFATSDSLFLAVLSSSIHLIWALRAGGRLGAGDDPRYLKAICFDPFPFPHLDQPTISIARNLGEQLDAHRKRQQDFHPDLTITGMYNVLEKLRSGEALTANEKVIHEQGLVSVLKKIHDELDAAVFDAYGWPHDLTDEEILERLVALNAERAEEERRGIIRWLRPEFQNPENRQQPTQQQIAGTSIEVKAPKTAVTNGKPDWPKSLPDQLTAIRDTFHQARTPLDAPTVARTFKGARTKEVEQVLASLEALGHLIAVSEDPRQWKATR